MRARDNRQGRVVAAHIFHNRRGVAFAINRHNQQLRVRQARRAQQFRVSCIAVIRFDAQLRQALHHLRVVINHRRVVAASRQHAVDVLPKPPVSQQNHRIGFVNRIVLTAFRVLFLNCTRRKNLFINNKQQRRQHHRQRHHQVNTIQHRFRQNMVRLRNRQQHETKFPRLRQTQRKQLSRQ